MSIDVVLIFLLAMLGAGASWLVPAKYALDAMAGFTFAVLALFSPPTALYLLLATMLTWAALHLPAGRAGRNVVAATIALLLLGGFVAAQFTSGMLWIGASFFTLRLLHVTGDWWTGRLAAPRLPALLRYQFFLPAMIVGPIHRLQNFERQAVRRRWDAGSFFTGLERCLVGFFMAHFLGDVVVGQLSDRAELALEPVAQFARVWALSAIGWVRLFFVFAGLTAAALGASLMAGIKLEENFNQPWRATSLLDFWNRWHMSLTSWSRDYAYSPVMAITRSPLLGLLVAMLVIGLWHDISLYYVCWSFWQALGIIASRIGGKLLPNLALAPALRTAIIPLAILAWLSAARPVIMLLLGVDYDANLALF